MAQNDDTISVLSRLSITSSATRKIHFYSEYPKSCIIFAVEKGVDMYIKFEKEYLSELFYTGRCSDKRYRFQPDIVKRYKRRIETLNDANDIETLYKYNSLRYEVLTGDKAGISSIRVNDQYRIEFTVSQESGGKEIITICNIIELSNHYK